MGQIPSQWQNTGALNAVHNAPRGRDFLDLKCEMTRTDLTTRQNQIVNRCHKSRWYR